MTCPVAKAQAASRRTVNVLPRPGSLRTSMLTSTVGFLSGGELCCGSCTASCHMWTSFQCQLQTATIGPLIRRSPASSNSRDTPNRPTPPSHLSALLHVPIVSVPECAPESFSTCEFLRYERTLSKLHRGSRPASKTSRSNLRRADTPPRVLRTSLPASFHRPTPRVMRLL